MSISGVGQKKYDRLVRLFKEGYLSLCVYENVYDFKTFYDVVLYRKVRTQEGAYEYRRGTNLKPSDLPALEFLVNAARSYLSTLDI